MQLAVVPRRYPTSVNHTPRTFEAPSENSSALRCRGTVFSSASISAQSKQSILGSEGGEERHLAMAHLTTNPVVATAPLSSSGVKGANALRKAPSLMIQQRPCSPVSRRHSWTSPSCVQDQNMTVPTPVMESLQEHEVQAGDASPESSRVVSTSTSFASTRAGATFEMAYFLRNTGPPPAPVRETLKDQVRKPVRKRTRGFLKRRKEEPEQTLPAEEPTERCFVPPEGVQQKVTAGGKKYLQIVPHPDLIDLREHYQTQHQTFASPKSDQSAAESNEALDTWLSALSLQNQVGDLSVKSPVGEHVQSRKNSNSSALHSRSRTPLSFVSEARSMLAVAEDGFGLSIIDCPVSEPYCNRAPPRSEALCSNPTSDHEELRQVVHEHNTDAVALSAPTTRVDSKDCGKNKECLAEVDLSKADDRLERRPSDVLAGQGMRRPVKEVSSDQSLKSSELYPAATTQSRRNREAAVRARKIKAMQEARQSTDTSYTGSIARSISLPQGRWDTSTFSIPARHLTSSPSKSSLPPSQNRLTSTMIVAEQAPLPRGRSLKKPARLVLPNSPFSQVTSHRNRISPTKTYDVSPLATPPRQLKPRTPLFQAPQPPPKSSARNTAFSLSTPFFTPAAHSKHHSTPHLSTPASLTPQAVTATAALVAGSGGGARTSVCSSHTSHSREARLEARLEAVERENRLLEAALMAVLKTSGTLNRCPCVVLKERENSHAKSVDHLDALRPAGLDMRASRSMRPLPKVPLEISQLGSESVADSDGGRKILSGPSIHTDRVSVDSDASTISALEVYLRTKIGI